MGLKEVQFGTLLWPVLQGRADCFEEIVGIGIISSECLIVNTYGWMENGTSMLRKDKITINITISFPFLHLWNLR